MFYLSCLIVSYLWLRLAQHSSKNSADLCSGAAAECHRNGVKILQNISFMNLFMSIARAVWEANISTLTPSTDRDQLTVSPADQCQ